LPGNTQTHTFHAMPLTQSYVNEECSFFCLEWKTDVISILNQETSKSLIV
jgi:hypothetical protein